MGRQFILVLFVALTAHNVLGKPAAQTAYNYNYVAVPAVAAAAEPRQPVVAAVSKVNTAPLQAAPASPTQAAAYNAYKAPVAPPAVPAPAATPKVEQRNDVPQEVPMVINSNRNTTITIKVVASPENSASGVDSSSSSSVASSSSAPATAAAPPPPPSGSKDGKAFAWCFGYGSLVNSFAEKAKFVKVKLPYRRVWNAWNTKARATFLGLEATNETNIVSGIIYPIYSQQEMDDLVLREQGYAKLNISHDNVEILNEGIKDEIRAMKLEPQMQLFTFVPESEGNAPNAMFPILSTYVDLCAGGFLKFRKENQPRDESDPVRNFLDTTFGWSEYFLNDRVVARRPWKHEDNSFVIDDYLDDEDDVHDIPAALYPVDYAVVYFDELRKGLALIGHDRIKYVANTNAQFFGM